MVQGPAPAVPVAPPASPDRLQLLRELAELRQLGALTDEEFEVEKARVMGGDVTAPALPSGGTAVAALPAGSLAGEGPQPGWFPDPTGRHEHRAWDGSDWTARVSDGGVEGYDPPLL